LPKSSSGEIKNGVFGLYVTKDKIIVASSNDNFTAGMTLELDDKFFNIENGYSYNEIIIYASEYYAVSVTCSKGYREFKSSSDDYQNDIFAFFFSYISKADLEMSKKMQSFSVYSIGTQDSGKTKEIATFFIGDRWLGIHSEDIIETVSADLFQPSLTLNNTFHFKGTLVYHDQIVSVLDLRKFVKTHDSSTLYSDILIIKYGQGAFERLLGILVDYLGDIIEIEKSKITPIDKFFISNGALMHGIVVPDGKSNHSQALTILNIEKIGKELVINTAMESIA